MKVSDTRASVRTPYSSEIYSEHISFPINIALLDDHPLVTASLFDLLTAQPGINVKHSESESRHLFTALATHTCDVVVLDFFLPNDRWDGIELIKRIRRGHPEVTIIVYTAGQSDETRSSVFRAGANAYLSKSQPYLLLPNMIRMAASTPDSFFYCSNGEIECGPPPLREDLLTLCELEVLRQIANGYSVSKIAERLVRSKKTVSTHKRRAMSKLKLADDLALALYLRDRYQRYTS